MAKPTKLIKVHHKTWIGLSKLRERYNLPINHIVDSFVYNVGSWKEMDEIFGYSPKKKKKK